jgi:[ribosomal protein S5]-alanine N-acetyltransferase
MIKLRDYFEDDDSSLVENANNPNVAAYMRKIFPSPFQLSDAKWWINEGHVKEGSYNRVIDLDGKFIGNIGYHPIDGHPASSVELGYWIGEPYWNKGVISEAIERFAKHVFLSKGVATLTATVAGPNIASMKALEKCGFICSAINTKSIEVRTGVFDEHVYVKNS